MSERDYESVEDDHQAPEGANGAFATIEPGRAPAAGESDAVLASPGQPVALDGGGGVEARDATASAASAGAGDEPLIVAERDWESVKEDARELEAVAAGPPAGDAGDGVAGKRQALAGWLAAALAKHRSTITRIPARRAAIGVTAGVLVAAVLLTILLSRGDPAGPATAARAAMAATPAAIQGSRLDAPAVGSTPAGRAAAATHGAGSAAGPVAFAGGRGATLGDARPKAAPMPKAAPGPVARAKVAPGPRPPSRPTTPATPRPARQSGQTADDLFDQVFER